MALREIRRNKMKHRWHDEIVAWAGGAEIEVQCGDGRWITSSPSWSDSLKYRIKPPPKEKKYLYVIQMPNGDIKLINPSMLYMGEHIGKIEVQND